MNEIMAEEDPKPDPAAPSPEDQTQLVGSGGGTGVAGVKLPYLVLVDGPHKGSRYPLQSGINIIGRLEECHVVLDDLSVSRKHAELNLLEQGWTLKDLQSKNGSFVNGARISEPVVIGHKDLLRFGIYMLRFVAQAISAEEEMQVPKQDVSEWGTVVMPAESGGGAQAETARFVVEAGSPSQPVQAAEPTGQEITGEHSPLEEEELGAEPAEEVSQEEAAPAPRARIWLLSGVLFVLVLGTGLYFYWQTVLAPEEKPKTTAAAPKPIPQTIPLGPPEPVKPKTVPIFLDCVANPFPAMVKFQEKEIGQTPLKINVELEPDKTYEIEARFQMPEIQETYTDRLQFKITAEQSMVPLLFRAPVGTIKVTALPRDASLYLEAYFDYNKFQGRPVKLTQLVLNKPIFAPYGRYIAELRQAKTVGDPTNVIEDIVWRREFVLQEQNPAFALDVPESALRQFPAEIHSVPPGADVFIDQQKVGLTPFVGMVAVGKHTLTLRREGYFETTQEMATEINMPYKVEVPLRTSLAGDKINQAKSFVNQGMFPEAIQSLSDVFAQTPTPRETAEARYLLGNIFLTLKDYSKAQGYYEQAREHDDFKYWAKLGIVSVLAELGQTQQALIPLVEVLLNAKDEFVLKEGHNTLRKISPLRSVVYIQSEPAGAHVYLNDSKLGQVTPVLLHEMGLGSYKIRLEKSGFQTLDLSVSLSVNEFNPVLAKLKPLLR